MNDGPPLNCPNCGAPITGEICEYCGKRHGTSWFAKFLYAIHRMFKAIKDLFNKISGN